MKSERIKSHLIQQQKEYLIKKWVKVLELVHIWCKKMVGIKNPTMYIFIETKSK